MVEVGVERIIIEEISHDGGGVLPVPLRRGAIIAVVKNPFANGYVDEIASYMDELRPLADAMVKKLIDALGGDPALIQSYGKGAIVGAAGELEHGALWHVPGGHAMRAALGERAKAIVPSSKKVGAIGAALDIPLTSIEASYVRSHFDALEISQPGAPKADEVLFALVMTTGGRIHARVGGLRLEDIEGKDGLR